MKKGGFLRNVLDTIRSNQTGGQSGRGPGSAQADRGVEFGGQLKPTHFALGQVARHGFPKDPTALTFDPVQKIAAIGTKSGAIRIFGRPGVDVWAQHEPAFAVTHIKFIVNQGAIITVTSDESIHLWSLRGPNLKLQFSISGAPSGPSLSSACSPAPTPASTVSSASPQSGVSAAQATTTSASGSSFLGQITDTVTGAVDSASDFLSGNSISDQQQQLQATPSPTGAGETGAHAFRQPELLYTLKFQREHITYIHQTLASKWLYIGTERGNVHVANVETFELSGYSIAWNKAIELSRKTHPGAIIHLSECPQDTNKLLIGYESGCIVIWDLKQRTADGRYYHTEMLLWLAWHHEGKQFVAAHGDGSLITWQTRSNAKPAQILYPHAKTASTSGGAICPNVTGGLAFGGQDVSTLSQQQQQQQQQSLASSIARSLNNELYRPISKIEWKTSKSTNEQFLLFSGGLPYDDLDQAYQPAAASGQDQPQQQTGGTPLVRQQTVGSGPRFGSIRSTGQQPPLGAAASSAAAHASSPISSSISPSVQQQQELSSRLGPSALHSKEKKSLRSTSLTVMYGKSITVLEMDDMIVDFITVCDNSPYENDTSDPYAVIVLLSNELILIDLTSSGYPSFDSPYPSASLNESPVTCVQYLADCTTDLIPFLYSSSHNSVSRAPKKGFSDKEWPINGGEWGQSMQSYPELVLTGHADGTIKFWDMSGINFDLISKIKTSKLFERPNRLNGSIIFTASTSSIGPNPTWRPTRSSSGAALRPGSPFKANLQQQQHSDEEYPCSSAASQAAAAVAQQQQQQEQNQTNQTALDESLFAIEKIEFCPSTKRLLVASAFSQVILFKMNKKDAHSSVSCGGGGELTTILVEPAYPAGLGAGSTSGVTSVSDKNSQHQAATSAGSVSQFKQHLLLRTRDSQTAAASSSGGSSSSSSSHRSRGLGGFQAELVCSSPLLLTSAAQPQSLSLDEAAPVEILGTIAGCAEEPSAPYYCQMPPKISALAFQATHNILAYSHENGVVLVDIIQKCLIISATLSDLYGGTSMMNISRDVSIQPYATSSILQHHHLATGGQSESSQSKYNDNGSATRHKINLDSDNVQTTTAADSGVEGSNNSSKLNRLASASGTTPNGGQFAGSGSGLASGGASAAARQPPAVQSKYTTNSMFQRQLSTNTLNSVQQPNEHSAVSSGGHSKARLLQRQMTASQLFASSSLSSSSGQQQQESCNAGSKRLLASIRADPSLVSSAVSLATASSGAGAAAAKARPPSASGALPGVMPLAQQTREGATAAAAAAMPKKAAKNKRIISRMLSISAIHTSVGSAHQENQNASTATAATTTGTTSSDDASAHANELHTAGNGVHRNLQRFYATAGSEHGGADKFSDSSFTRSRSSSSSSANNPIAVAAAAAAAAGQPPSVTSVESIQCIAFLDPARAALSATLLAAGSSQQPASGGAQSSGASSNHKSLSSIDSNSGGQLALWVGTSSGSVLLVNLTLPDNEDNRILQLQSINAEPIPQASIKLAGQILSLEAFVCEPRAAQWTSAMVTGEPMGAHSSIVVAAHQQQQQLTSQSGSLESSAPEVGAGGNQAAATSHSPLGSCSSVSGGGAATGSGLSSGADSRSALFLLVVSQKQARVYQVPASAAGWSLPAQTATTTTTTAAATNESASASSPSSSPASQLSESPLCKLLANKRNLVAECELSESSYACRARLVQWRAPDECCLVSYLATGNLLVHPLPRLRPVLLDADFVPYTSARLARTMCFSRNGHCLYQPSEGEICKFTLSSSYKALVNDMLGLVYVPREMPEQPRANFFKSLFSVSQATKKSDRDELFGECASGKAARNVAKHLCSSGGQLSATDKLKSAAIGTMGHEMRMAREGLDERGERLGELEDRTLNMLNHSEAYSQAAHQLAQKFKDKKWYQF